MGTFFDSFMPALTGSLAQAPLAGAQGHVQGMTTAMDLARLHAQIQQQQIANQQAQQAFPLQQQQLLQQLKLNAAPQWQVRQPGTTLEQIDPLTGRTTGQARQVPLNPLQEAQKGMYSGGLSPAGSVEELLKRQLVTDPDNPTLLASLAAIQRFKGGTQGISGPIDEQSMRTMAEQGRIDPNYHPKFTGPYAAINQQNYEIFKARPSEQGAASPKQQAAQNYDTKIVSGAKKKFMEDITSGDLSKKINATNTAVQHLDIIKGAIQAIQSTDPTLIRRYKNQLSMAFSIPEGDLPAMIGALGPIVAGEIAKTMVTTGGSVGEREEEAKALTANWSARTAGVIIAGLQRIMAGKIEATRFQYKQTTGRNDFDQQYLMPHTQNVLKEPVQGSEAAEKPSAKAAPKASATLPTIKTDADWEKLPSGTDYIDPTGKKRTKK